MDIQSQKKLMHACFMYMMANRILSSEQTMLTALKSITYILGNTHHLTQVEQDNCLIYFFNDYSQGCSSPISESYMRNTLIPAIKTHGIVDIPLAGTIIGIALENI